jgi:hypothetical protein
MITESPVTPIAADGRRRIVSHRIPPRERTGSGSATAPGS